MSLTIHQLQQSCMIHFSVAAELVRLANSWTRIRVSRVATAKNILLTREIIFSLFSILYCNYGPQKMVKILPNYQIFFHFSCFWAKYLIKWRFVAFSLIPPIYLFHMTVLVGPGFCSSLTIFFRCLFSRVDGFRESMSNNFHGSDEWRHSYFSLVATLIHFSKL